MTTTSNGDGHPRAVGDRAEPRGEWKRDGTIPKWVHDALVRVTPDPRIPAAVGHLERSAAAFTAGSHQEAKEEAVRAKALSPRDGTVRELIALSAYRLGEWDTALRELRAFRRMTGELIHVPVELDVLRALNRPTDVEALWQRIQGVPIEDETVDEARVVYGSFLLDQGDAQRAWEVTDPKRLSASPREGEVRVWYVAAKAALALGDHDTALRLRDAIEAQDLSFPGLDELAPDTA